MPEKKEKKITKHCHTNPEFYLNNFVVNKDNTFFVYDKKDLSVRPQRPSGTTVINYYYIIEHEGEKDSCLEEVLSDIESAALFRDTMNTHFTAHQLC